MSTYLLCLADDLSKDADLYQDVIGARIISLSDLSNISSDDTLVLYTHGQYTTAGPVPCATNKIQWGRAFISADKVCENLFDNDFPTGVSNVTLIVHACFSAGTIEGAPAINTDTFAGQLCSALKAFYLPGLRVVGYQGQSKMGKAGFATGTTENAPRLTRRQADPNQGSLWQVIYGGPGDADGHVASGASVRWG